MSPDPQAQDRTDLTPVGMAAPSYHATTRATDAAAATGVQSWVAMQSWAANERAEAADHQEKEPLNDSVGYTEAEPAEILAWHIHWSTHRRANCQCATPSDDDLEHGRRATVALAAAGRLLPPDTPVEWGVRDRTGKVRSAFNEEDARTTLAPYGEPVRRHAAGPWIPVPPPAVPEEGEDRG